MKAKLKYPVNLKINRTTVKRIDRRYSLTYLYKNKKICGRYEYLFRVNKPIISGSIVIICPNRSRSKIGLYKTQRDVFDNDPIEDIAFDWYR